MNVSGSSIAAYYAGNAAQALDRQAAQQSQAAAQQRLQQFNRPQPLNEQILEGELLNKAKQQAQFDSERGGEESASQQQRSAAPPQFNTLSANPAIRQYQATAQLDGFATGEPRHQLDIYV